MCEFIDKWSVDQIIIIVEKFIFVRQKIRNQDNQTVNNQTELTTSIKY